MKKLFLLTLLSILLYSCSSDEVGIEGTFVKVIDKNNESGLYFFNYKDTLTIHKNGKQYLINQNGNKQLATFKDNILNLQNNCKILVDQTENTLVKTCGGSGSEDFWPKEKAEKYLSDKDLKHKIIKYLSKLYKDDIDEGVIKTGDFNNDGKVPDIAFMGLIWDDVVLYATTFNIKLAGHRNLLKLLEYEYGPDNYNGDTDGPPDNLLKFEFSDFPENHFILYRTDNNDDEIYYVYKKGRFHKYNYNIYGAN